MDQNGCKPKPPNPFQFVEPILVSRAFSNNTDTSDDLRSGILASDNENIFPQGRDKQAWNRSKKYLRSKKFLNEDNISEGTFASVRNSLPQDNSNEHDITKTSELEQWLESFGKALQQLQNTFTTIPPHLLTHSNVLQLSRKTILSNLDIPSTAAMAHSLPSLHDREEEEEEEEEEQDEEEKRETNHGEMDEPNMDNKPLHENVHDRHYNGTSKCNLISSPQNDKVK
ncbi:hypothetical protein RFI_23299 [Reticulomyxa filosa]|uniref:Uncharacterized protein n=1 Tax=Reticulomyxa filosa TaxID=46433 RepID=X6MK83_RETFI|nr:hypothetical protein RFI_23299 [Reticulomyxa filosa]|eukprot:ETO14071.1 hypothetical protein RFI_23299 [Reticulomyxa filosa]